MSKMKKWYGSAALHPATEVVAASYGTWTLTYTAGEKGVGTGGAIRIYTDSDSDRATPQLDDPTGADYLTVDAPKEARVGVLVQSVMSLSLTVNGRALAPGERIRVTYGDTRGGGPGFRAQTFAEARHYFWVDVDAGDGNAVTLPDPPALRIVGGEAETLAINAPSIVARGEAFRIQVKAEDAWGNPAAYRGEVRFDSGAVRVPENVTFDPADGGVRWIEGCIAQAEGIHRLNATDGTLTAQSNPIECRETAPEQMLYWGDSHGGQVALAEKIPDFFRYARDVAGIHFAGYQRNDHVLSTRDWALQREAERAYHQPGRFVALPGFEWSAQTTRGGHHNVYFRRHDQPIRRSGHEGLADKSDADTDLTHITAVYEAYRGTDTVITAHVGGEHSDLQYHDPYLEPAVEITSDHGTFEWILQETFERDYRMGFFGGSDSHNGRPGNDAPGFQHRRYAKAGLAAVYAPELTIESVLDAYKARRIYATTGARILLRTDCEGHGMGEEFTTRNAPRISAFVAGTAPFESVDLYRGLDRIYSHPIAAKKRPPARARDVGGRQSQEQLFRRDLGGKIAGVGPRHRRGRTDPIRQPALSRFGSHGLWPALVFGDVRLSQRHRFRPAGRWRCGSRIGGRHVRHHRPPVRRSRHRAAAAHVLRACGKGGLSHWLARFGTRPGERGTRLIEPPHHRRFRARTRIRGRGVIRFYRQRRQTGRQSVLCPRGANRYGNGVEQSHFCGLRRRMSGTPGFGFDPLKGECGSVLRGVV